MPQINRFALVPYSAEKMYNLVNDVDSYPQFLPGCVGSLVLNHVNNEMTTSVEVAKAGISKTFITHNILQDNKSIQIQLVKGLFRKLMGNWLFIPLNENACKVELFLDFEFTNKLIELAFGRIFKELAGNMVQAFTQRAHEVYRGRNKY
ncbi:Persistence and stress-resistance toxin PasT [Arsenophonus endosymbiont of Aleurodicus floccissimus]|uniref:SRPBCC family protein n=1 Tax=Arsenophonus endosymbiont of Aleurodicus floccissimus TaxID=2152761 RepID=UPI000ED780F5|nr:SRPBCC family protein [Arsenophonus endosymbiont of Aleurodicus floccissimus]SPP31729.1 Persistence and stress-resistance toxin PasT [Arsenophonus endosymbiont of Aleurodicus floccissimus]